MLLNNKFIWISIPLLLILVSCERPISGNGIINSHERVLEPFEEINASDEININVIESNEYRAVVTCESNIIPYIITKCLAGKLIIEPFDDVNFRNVKPIIVDIYCPTVSRVDMDGSGNLYIDTFNIELLEVNIEGSNDLISYAIPNNYDLNISGSGDCYIKTSSEILDIDILGSSDIEVEGIIKNLDINIIGSGNINTLKSFNTNCYIVIEGSGNIKTFVDQYLDIKIYGSGNIVYLGNPIVNSKIYGSGEIIKY